MGLAESAAQERYFIRMHLVDPLSAAGNEFDPGALGRFPRRVARVTIEDAAVRVASGGDHITNGYLRLAWEANAAPEDEVRAANPTRRRQSRGPRWRTADEGSRRVDARARAAAASHVDPDSGTGR